MKWPCPALSLIAVQPPNSVISFTLPAFTPVVAPNWSILLILVLFLILSGKACSLVLSSVTLASLLGALKTWLAASSLVFALTLWLVVSALLSSAADTDLPPKNINATAIATLAAPKLTFRIE